MAAEQAPCRRPASLPQSFDWQSAGLTGWRRCAALGEGGMHRAVPIEAGGLISGRSLPAAGLTLAVVDDLGTLADAWRVLEASACVSPYQRYDFILAWAVEAAAGEGIEARIGVVRDGFGQVVMI